MLAQIYLITRKNYFFSNNFFELGIIFFSTIVVIKLEICFHSWASSEIFLMIWLQTESLCFLLISLWVNWEFPGRVVYVLCLCYLIPSLKYFKLLTGALGGKKNYLFLPLKWDIIFWDTHNTFLWDSKANASFSSHSDDIVRKQADKLWWNHSHCLMFLVKFFIGIYIWYTQKWKLPTVFSIWCIFNHVFPQ